MKKAKKTITIPCGVAIVKRGHEVLIAQRNETDTFGSFWEFPGGKRDRGETFEQCVVREVKEECGIDIAVDKKVMEIRKKYNDRIIWLNFFICDYRGGEASPIDCQKVRWVGLGDLKNYQFPPANDRVIEYLLKDQSQNGD